MNLEGQTVLLVEDDPSTALVQQKMLMGLQLTAIWVQTGEQAVTQILNDPSVDFILMDIDLGAGINGIEATKEILKIRKIPILICTNHTSQEISALIDKIQIYGFIDKGANATIFKASIRQALHLFEADRELYKINSDLNGMLTQIRSFIDNAPAAIAMFDNDLRFLEANNMYYQEYNIKIPEIRGKHLYDVFPETPIRWKKIYVDCLEGGEFSSDFDLFFRSDETIDFVKWKVKPWYDERKQIGGIILFSVVLNKFLAEYKGLETSMHKPAHEQ
jgi:Response regulator containing CheY-like receiver, AAA-type ATPase, and DNA-binding domains